MMHRYVAVVPTQAGSNSQDAILRRARNHFPKEALVLDTPRATAWVFKTHPSQLGHRLLRNGGCLIGLDFRPDAHDVATLLQDTWGAYVAIAIDAAAGSVTVLRDPTGRIACWRMQLGGADILFSHYEDVYWLQERPPSINWAFLAHYLGQDWLYGGDTGLEGITELLPGEELVYARGQSTTRMRWQPHLIAEDAHPTLEAAQTAMRQAGEIAVCNWADRYGRASIDLSGGLDSAIVLGLLRGVARHPDVVGLNMKTPGAEGDERVYAQAAATLHDIPLKYRDIQSDTPDFEMRFPHKFLRPLINLIPSGYADIRSEFARQEGVEAQFTGMGGDHLFSLAVPVGAVCDYLHHGGSLRGYFGVAGYLARLSRSTMWSAFSATADHYLGRRSLPDSLLQMKQAFRTQEAVAAVDHERFSHPWVAPALEGSPPGKRLQIVSLIHLRTLYRREGNADISEETHALISQPLMEACLRTPTHWFGVGGIQRGLARRAFSDLLPSEIRERRSKGGSTPYFIQFAVSRLPKIRELLLDGRLAQKGLLDRARMEEALTSMSIMASMDISPLLRCLRTELWVRQTEADNASPLRTTPTFRAEATLA